jgi:hypothetical protein
VNAPATFTHWHIIETGTRWYQALLRFTSGATHFSAASLFQSRTVAAGSPHIIRRWDSASAHGVISWATQHQAEQVVLLWELPAEPKAFLGMLEAIATVKRSNRIALQLAYVPARRSTANRLSVQEAGADFLLSDLWSLEHVVRRLR